MQPIKAVKSFVFVKLTKISPTRGFSTILGFCSFMWGLWVINPASESLNPEIYGVILDIAPEWFWALFFVFSGLTKLIGVFKRNTKWIRISTYLGSMLWFGLSVFLLSSAPQVTGVTTYLCLGLMNAWIYLQVRFHPEIISGNKIMPDTWETNKQVKKRQDDENA